MKSNPTIEGVGLLELGLFSDSRGDVRKLVSQSSASLTKENFTMRDQYFSYSLKGVFRGLHVQAKPASGNKVVTPVMGKIVDVLLDLRVSSSTFGRVDSYVLSAEDGLSVFVPPGVAHGYGCLTDSAAVVFSSTVDYRPDLEFGVSCESLDFPWPLGPPILSEKDQSLPNFESLNIDFLTDRFKD